MTPAELIAAFEMLAEAPDGVSQLRELVLQLAVRGLLVEQRPADRSAEVLVERIMASARGRKIRVEVHHEAEKPFHVPRAWGWVYLGDAMELFNGCAFKPTDWKPSGMRIVRIQNLNDATAAYNYCDPSVAERFCIDSGCLLLSWSGTPGTSFGAFVWQGGRAALNQHIFRCEPRGDAFATHYLRLAINSRLNEMIARAHGGVGLRHITKGKLEGLWLPVPPLAEQHRIVARVEELMGLLDRLEAARTKRESTRAAARDSVLAALREADSPEAVDAAWTRFAQRMDDLLCDPADIAPLRQTVLQLAVRGRLVHQDPEDEPASVLLRRIRSEGLVGSIPEMEPVRAIPWALPSTWSWVRLREIADFSIGKTPPTKDSTFWADVGGYAWVSIADMEHGRTLTSTSRRVSDRAAKEVFRYAPVPAGTMLMSFKLTIGKVARLGCPAYHNEGIISVRPATPDAGDYLFVTIPVFASAGDTNAAIKGATLNKSSLTHMMVALPPAPEQRRIVARVDELMGLLDRLERRLTAAKATQAAFAGAAVHHVVA
jgi:type I restriction enzyme S subunit